MLKRKSKVQQRLAKVVLSALLLSGALPGIVGPSVAQAATDITITNVTAGSSGPIITAKPNGSMTSYGNYSICPSIVGVGDVTITGSSIPVMYEGFYDEDETGVSGHKVTVSGANTVLGGVIGANGTYGAVVSNNTVEIKDATIKCEYEDLGGVYVGGGQSMYSDAATNTVEISGATIGSEDGNYPVQVIGGSSFSPIAPEGDFAPKVTDNKVTVTGDGTRIYGDVIGGANKVTNKYYYYASIATTVENNKVTVTGDSTKIYGDVIGGTSEVTNSYYASASIATTVENNTVNINGGEVQRAIGGVSYTDLEDDEDNSISGTVNINTVNITGGKVTGLGYDPRDINSIIHIRDDRYRMVNVAGGIAYNGNATNNNVNISGGQINGSRYAGVIVIGYGGLGMIVGGLAQNGEATGNQVTVSGGTLGGGETYPLVTAALGDGTDDDGGGETAEAPAIVVGGLSTHKANNNTVTISGGDIKDGVFIFGGVVEPMAVRVPIGGEEEATPDTTSYEANNNKVNILIPLNAYYLVGGLNPMSESVNAGSGNTLNIAAKNVTASFVGGFQNMNFYLPKDIANKDTMLTIKGIERWSEYDYETGEPAEGATKEILGNDLTGVKFGVAALKGVNLKKGDKVTLVKGENGLVTDSKLDTSSDTAEFLQQNNMTTEEKYELSIKKEGENAIVTTVDDVKENETSPDARKSPVETRMAVVTMINAGTDLLAGQGMANAEVAAQEVKGGSSMFAAMSGGQLRAESGSHVTTKGLGLNLGFAKEIENKSGKLMFGPVLEYGHGNYDSYQDNGMTADGKASYWGLGFIAKQTNDNGFYYEGSVRVGRAKSDYGSDSIVENSHISYDSTATYWAAHLGAGKVMDIGHNNTMDYYGKYFYSHTGGDSATIYRDGEEFDEVSFSGVNSNRFRVGARLTHAVNEKNNIYAGLAYQYEFSGTARATYRQGAAPSPGVKGSSGMIELGWQVKAGKKSPMAIDLGVTGWVGKQRGVTANLQANWTF